MKKRTLTGAVILLLTVTFVLLRQFSLLIFDLYVLIVSIGACFEICKAYKAGGKHANLPSLLVSAVAICVIFNFGVTLFEAFLYILILVLLVLSLNLTADIVSFAKKRKNGEQELDISKQNQLLFDNTKYTMMALVYPVIMLSFLFALNHLGYGAGYMGIILVFAVSMLTDTCAYLFGSAFGKRKFIPEVSPNKTVAGLVGGFVGGILGATVCFLVFYFTSWFDLSSISLAKSISAFALVGVVGSYLNQLGDLVASALKRKVQIKDYGNIFPGHGGFMDRVDGQMFVGAFVFVIFACLLV